MRKITRRCVVVGLATLIGATAAATSGNSGYAEKAPFKLQVGTDANYAGNPFVQPQGAAQSGGDIDQTLQYGDVLYGTPGPDLLIGGLGTDVLLADRGDDVLIGGLEHFNPQGKDRKFGGPGNDILIWAPGDNSDLLDGGPGEDVLILGLVAELANGERVFRVANDQHAGQVYVDQKTGLPLIDASHAPGFCEVIDRSSYPDAAEQLQQLGEQQLVRFFLRKEADSYANGEQTTDNGLRQTMHLVDVEFLICTNREGTGMAILDLRKSPPGPVLLKELKLVGRLSLMLQ